MVPMELSSKITWQQWIERNLGPIKQRSANHGGLLTLESGTKLFLKHYQGSNASQQASAENQGLLYLNGLIKSEPKLSVVKPVAVGENWLLLPWIEQSRVKSDWRSLGRGLAQLHQQPQSAFGFHSDNFCGPTPQPNPSYKDGYQFFASARLRHQAYLNQQRGMIDQSDTDQIDRFCQKLPELIPKQLPAAIHGDLWSGNVLFNRAGEPVLIDPACHHGWPEAELAMTVLFGGFEAAFYHAYEETMPLEPGWRQRTEIYNLYHLLNHLYLFGSGYYGQVKTILNRYTA